MKLGHGEQQHVIEKSLVERYLGLIISSDLKWATQVEKASKAAAKALIAQIGNNFMYFDAELVRPHLELAVPVWNLYMKKDIEKLENIQHRATRLASNLRKNCYRLLPVISIPNYKRIRL